MRPDRRATARRATLAGALALAALAAAGCRQDMHDAPRYKPLAESTFFADGSAARPLPAGTVARGFLRDDKLFHTGRTADGAMATAPPMPVTRELLLRGRERYDIFCSPCHGALGDGRGMVVRRGFKQPSSFHVDRLRNVPIGYFFYNITNGFGVMSSYATQIPPEDRWAISVYLRALQRSQHLEAASLSPEDRARLDATVPSPAAGH